MLISYNDLEAFNHPCTGVGETDVSWVCQTPDGRLWRAWAGHCADSGLQVSGGYSRRHPEFIPPIAPAGVERMDDTMRTLVRMVPHIAHAVANAGGTGLDDPNTVGKLAAEQAELAAEVPGAAGAAGELADVAYYAVKGVYAGVLSAAQAAEIVAAAAAQAGLALGLVPALMAAKYCSRFAAGKNKAAEEKALASVLR